MNNSEVCMQETNKINLPCSSFIWQLNKYCSGYVVTQYTVCREITEPARSLQVNRKSRQLKIIRFHSFSSYLPDMNITNVQ